MKSAVSKSNANTGGLNLGMALDAGANLYMCTADRGAVFKVTPAGEVSQYSFRPLRSDR